MKQIVTHFTDNDLYTFTCQYYILMRYPRAEVEYSFFDRNHTVYPKGFAALLQELSAPYGTSLQWDGKFITLG